MFIVGAIRKGTDFPLVSKNPMTILKINMKANEAIFQMPITSNQIIDRPGRDTSF